MMVKPANTLGFSESFTSGLTDTTREILLMFCQFHLGCTLCKAQKVARSGHLATVRLGTVVGDPSTTQITAISVRQSASAVGL